jgi:hypothetical protein
MIAGYVRACPTRTLREALGKKFLAVMPPPVNFPSAWTAAALVCESTLGALLCVLVGKI